MNESEPPTDWRTLATNNSTLVIYMPGRNLEALQQELLDAGLEPNTPAAIVSAASTPEQREHCTTLALLGTAPPMPAPSILLVGRTIERTVRSAINSFPSHGNRFWMEWSSASAQLEKFGLISFIFCRQLEGQLPPSAPISTRELSQMGIRIGRQRVQRNKPSINALSPAPRFQLLLSNHDTASGNQG